MISLIDVLKNNRNDLYSRVMLLSRDAAIYLREFGKNDIVHSKSIIQLLDQLIPESVLNNRKLLPSEGIYLLLMAVYLHDIGRSNVEGHHEINSYNIIKSNPLKFYCQNSFVAEAIAQICAAHANEKVWSIDKCHTEFGIQGLYNKPLNLGHYGALLRLADELDNSYVRVKGISRYTGSPRNSVRFIFPKHDEKIIEIQSEPNSKKEFNSLIELCKYSNKRLSEIRHKLEELKILYSKVVLIPENYN